jgi:hypothetical protein
MSNRNHSGTHLIPVDGKATSNRCGLAVLALGFASEPFNRALVLANVWLKLLEATPVVILNM